jgi:hypothetical protein
MKKLTFYLLFILLLSCTSNNGVNICLKNSSEFPISEIEIMTSDTLAKIEIQKLNKSEVISEFLNMNNVKKIDGDYFIEYKLKDSVYKRKFGYYTNGYPLESEISITIKQNIILVSQKQKNIKYCP